MVFNVIRNWLNLITNHLKSTHMKGVKSFQIVKFQMFQKVLNSTSHFKSHLKVLNKQQMR